MAAKLLPLDYNESTFPGDYADPAAWEAATDAIDMPAATPPKGEVLVWNRDTVWTTALTLELDGGASDEDYFRAIVAGTGNQGTPTSGTRIELSSSGASVACITLSESHATVSGMACKATTTLNNGSAIGLRFYSGTAGSKAVNCMAYNCVASTGANAWGAGFVVEGTAAHYLICCAAINCTGNLFPAGGCYVGTLAANSTTIYLYNCTFNGNVRGIQLANGTAGTTLTAYSKNCVFFDNTTNISTYGGSPITHTQTTNQTSGVTFAADGYHLGAATNNGTSLNPDADGKWDVTADIDGDAFAATPSIGCDQWVDTGNRRRRTLICGGSR